MVHNNTTRPWIKTPTNNPFPPTPYPHRGIGALYLLRDNPGHPDILGEGIQS